MAKIEKIAVIGAGNMGGGIAQKIAQEGLQAIVIDIKQEFVDRGIANIRKTLDAGVKRKILTAEQAEETMSRITASTDLNEVADADIVIEAVFEDKQVKTDLFKNLDGICSEKTILATNTSSFYVKDFAVHTSRPDRFVGLHYFFHPAKNRLLEIIPGEETSQETIDKCFLAAKLHGKTAILVKDAPGFAVNRFFVPFLNESTRMLEEGLANIPTIEEGHKRAFKMGMGPFELMNVTGIPIAVHSSGTLGKQLGPFYATADILTKQMEKGENWDMSGEIDESKIQAVSDRAYGVCLGVAAAMAEEGVATIEDTDRGAKIGLRWIQGPFEIMNRIGIDKTFELVKAISEKWSDFKMPEILVKQKELGEPFRFNLVDLDVKEDIAFITINRPEAMNALNEAVVAQLEERFNEAESNDAVKAVVFQGAGKAFIAGADIRYFIKNIKNNTIDETFKFTAKGHELFLRIENSSKHTIAVLDGLSLGGGSELALACQSIVATPAGSMGFPETGIGIFPGLGGMLRMSRQVGPELTKYYVFTGRSISAEQASELGIVTRLTTAAGLDETIREIASQAAPDKYRSRQLPDKFKATADSFSSDKVAGMLGGEIPETLKALKYKAPLAMKIANEIIDQQAEQSMAEGIATELGRLVEIFSSADALTGLSSLGGKRPEFKGE